MREPLGHVTVNERIPAQRFHRFVEEKVKDWMRDHDFADRPSEYEVAFFDEESLGEVSCLVVIQSGDHLWRSWETADNPKLALARSLKHLEEDNSQDANDSELRTASEAKETAARMTAQQTTLRHPLKPESH